MVIMIGDTHGDYPFLLGLVPKMPEGTTLIQVGDFGAGFPRRKAIEERWFPRIEAALKKQGMRMFVVRGNHDNPSFFHGQNMGECLKFVPDYHVETIDGRNYLFLGGAISIDRLVRKEGVDWWPAEVFNFDFEKIQSFRNIDVVIAHTAPQFASPQTLNQLVFQYAHGATRSVKAGKNKELETEDTTLIADLKYERMLVSATYEELKRNNTNLSAWFYGHFHFSHTEYLDDVKFKLLDVKEIYESGI